MTKRGWSDRQVEEVIRNLPRVTDDRDPRDIYQNVSLRLKKRRTFTWLMPSFAAAAAAVLIFLLAIPGFMDGNQKKDKEMAYELKREPDSAGIPESAEKDKASMESMKENSGQEQSKMALTQDTTKDPHGENATALYENEVGGQEAVTAWVPEKNNVNFLIPVSLAIPKTGESNWLESLTTVLGQLKEDEWGLEEYYPEDLMLKLDNKDTLVVNVPAGHKFSEGINQQFFLDTLNNNAASNSNISQIKFTTDGKTGIYLGKYGEVTNRRVVKKQNQAYFLSYQDEREIPYLVPAPYSQYQNIAEAIEAMKTEKPLGGLEPSVLPSFVFSNIDEHKKPVLYLTLAEGSGLQDEKLTLYSFEAILLTAKDFGYTSVKLENAPINKLGPFDLTTENKVPVGPNKLEIK